MVFKKRFARWFSDNNESSGFGFNNHAISKKRFLCVTFRFGFCNFCKTAAFFTAYGACNALGVYGVIVVMVAVKYFDPIADQAQMEKNQF